MIPVTALPRETTTQTARSATSVVLQGTGAKRRPSHQWAVAGVEPLLGDMLLDPLVLLVMARDAIKQQDILDAINCARTQLALP